MMPGMPDLGALLQQAQQMQADMAQAQADLALTEVRGHAGGGLVQATVTGDGRLSSLTIDPSVVDPTDVETLADLIVAAVRDATRAAAELAESKLGAMAGGLGGLGGDGGFDLSAFGLPGPGGVIDEDDEFEEDDEDDEDDEFGEDDDEDDGVSIDEDAEAVDAEAVSEGEPPAGPPARPLPSSGA